MRGGQRMGGRPGGDERGRGEGNLLRGHDISSGSTPRRVFYRKKIETRNASILPLIYYA